MGVMGSAAPPYHCAAADGGRGRVHGQHADGLPVRVHQLGGGEVHLVGRDVNRYAPGSVRRSEADDLMQAGVARGQRGDGSDAAVEHAGVVHVRDDQLQQGAAVLPALVEGSLRTSIETRSEHVVLSG